MHLDRRLRGRKYEAYHVRYYQAGFTSYCPLISCMEDSTAVVNVSFPHSSDVAAFILINHVM